MAAIPAVIGAYIGLVGPLTQAITQVVELSRMFSQSSNVPIGSSSSSFNNMVNIGVGMYEGGDQDNFGGDGIKVSGFTPEGTFVGAGKMPSMDQGQTYATPLDPSGSSVGSAQAWQLTLTSGGSNAVCVQFVELAWQNSVISGFDGSWGKTCGQDWYFSESTWGMTSDNKAYRPECFWMDKGSTSSKQHPLEEMWADMEAVISGASVSGSNSSTATYCNQQIMKFSSSTVDKKSNQVPAGLNKDATGSDAPPSKRSRIERYLPRAAPSAMPQPYSNGTSTNITIPASGNGTFISANMTIPAAGNGTFISANGTQTQLVVSDIESHSAKELCTHPRSRGPDFVSKMENLFCDMTSRKTYPLCTDTQAKDCFSIDTAGKKMMKRGEDGTSAADQVHRDYHFVQHWQG